MQDYKTIEVILVDDGSKDASKDIINKWALSDNRVNAYYKSNGGLSDARNFGLEKATGTYILFVYGDDWIDYDMVSTMLKAMESMMCMRWIILYIISFFYYESRL